MADAALPPPRFQFQVQAMPDLVNPLCWTALAVGIACRIFAGIDTPLWFDETFSAVIATQSSLNSLIRFMLTELSGPAYYSMLWGWEKLAGDSNIALRLPSLALSIATPIVILWKGHPDRQVRMIWAAVTALSVVGFDSATQARPYALLFLLATMQSIAFIRLIDDPRLGRAFAWTTLCALTVLTHYHGAVICGLQGVAYVVLCRARALRSWPALLPLVPMALWMGWHIPFVLGFAGGDATWYGTLTLDSLWLLPALLTGLAWPGVILLSAMMGSIGMDLWRTAHGRMRWPYSSGETALVASGMGAIAIVMAVGFVTPSFTSRYILPYTPAMLAAIALWIRRMGHLAPIMTAALLCAMIGSSASQLIGYIRDPQEDFRYAFNFEEPSAWIADQGAERLVFLWDSPTAGLPDPDGHMAAVGGFFLRRSAADVAVRALPWPRRGDPNRQLIQAAGQMRGSAILWAYDASVPSTRGRLHPWRIDRVDPRWRCRDFGRLPIHVVACVRKMG